MINRKQLKEFSAYVYSFYGHGQIYDMGCDIDDIEKAIYIYIGKMHLSDWMQWGGGDSVDRERVWNILMYDLYFYELKGSRSISDMGLSK